MSNITTGAVTVASDGTQPRSPPAGVAPRADSYSAFEMLFLNFRRLT